MKHSSQFLFKLIFGLSKKDIKSFLKILEFNNQADCIDLFKSIITEKEKSSNLNYLKIEKELKENLSPKLKKYYRVNKSKLKKELFDYLNKMNLEKDSRFLIREQIHTGVALAELGHNKEGLNIIQEAKEEAIKDEMFEEVLFALDKIRTYKLELRRNSKSALAFNDEFNQYQKILNNLNDYIALSFYIYSFQNDFSADIKKIENLRKNDLLQAESNALSIKAKKFYYLGRLDVLNALKQYDDMLDIILEAVDYAEEARRQNENFANTLLLMYERLQYVSTQLERYDISLKAISLMENFDVPKIYENNLFFYKLTKVVPKIKRLNIYSVTGNENLFSYCKEIENNFQELNMGAVYSENIYYKLLFNYTVKLSKHQDACILGKKYVKHVLENIDKVNPLNNFTIQSFLCYFLSAYVNHTEETFEYLFEYLFKKKNAKYFAEKNAPFFYVYQLYNVFLESYKYGFYSKEVLSTYYDIWSKYPDFLVKANCIPKTVLVKKYNKDMVESVSAKFSKVKFEC